MSLSDEVSKEPGVWIGVDFGTTHSCTAVWDSTRGHPKWMRLEGIAFPQGSKSGRLVPSVVLFVSPSAARQFDRTFPVNHIVGRDLYAVVGAPALDLLEQSELHLESAQASKTRGNKASVSWSPSEITTAMVTSVKRAISERDDETTRESLPYDIVQEEGPSDETSVVKIQVTPLGATEAVSIPVKHVIAVLLFALRQASEAYLKRHMRKKRLVVPVTGDSLDCRHCVVGAPAQWGRQAREQVKDAARLAGFSGNVQTLTESSAAVLCYGLTVAGSDDKRILVFDMGGGTTDVTIAELTDRNQPIRVVVTHGANVGGDTMDNAILGVFLKKLGESENDLTGLQRKGLVRRCKLAKEQLCGDVDHGYSSPVATVDIAFQGQTVQIDQGDMETSIEGCLLSARRIVREALLRYSALPSNEVDDLKMDEVILVGGATRVPAVRRVLSDLFPPPHPPELCQLDPLSAVAQGTAIQAAMNSGLVPMHHIKSALMLDSLPYAIGILTSPTKSSDGEERRFVEVLGKDSNLPVTGTATFQLANAFQPGVTISVVEAVREGPADLSYEPIQDFTFLLHRLTKKQSESFGNNPRSVDVTISMNQTGELIVSIYDENDPEHARRRRQQPKNGEEKLHPDSVLASSESEMLGLWILFIFLIVLYGITKVVFREEQLVIRNKNGS